MTKVLLLIGDGQDSDSLKTGLKLHGYELITTNQADELSLLAINEAPDLILIDMDTPGINGWQIIHTLKGSTSTWFVPAIAICNPYADGKTLIRVGFDSYFRKPIFLKYLFMRIDVLVEANPVADNRPEKNTPVSNPALVSTRSRPTINCPKQITQTTVVYVDDSPKDSQTMARIIKQAGYSYANIANPLEALPELLERKPSLIFLDLVMPMANGYELCAQIRRISVFSQTPVVIVTNNDGVADRVRAKIVGASDFLSKPITEQRVLKMVKKHLNPFQTIPSSSQPLSFFERLKRLDIWSR